MNKIEKVFESKIVSAILWTAGSLWLLHLISKLGD